MPSSCGSLKLHGPGFLPSNILASDLRPADLTFKSQQAELEVVFTILVYGTDAAEQDLPAPPSQAQAVPSSTAAAGVFFLESIFIDQATPNGTRPVTPVGAEPAAKLQVLARARTDARRFNGRPAGLALSSLSLRAAAAARGGRGTATIGQ